MAASNIPVGATAEKLQTWENNIGGEDVHSEATTPTNSSGVEIPVAQEHVTAASPHAVRLSDGTNFYKATTPSDTQPVSGSVTANAGTNLNTSALALEAGNLASILAGIGAQADAIVAAGAVGSLSAKLRRVTQGLEDLKAGITALPLPSGASTAANQTTIIGHVDGIEGGLGAAADAAATVGSTGSLSAKLRLMTSQLDAIQNALQIMDDWDNGASDGASVSGDVAHDAADAGEPVKIGGKARTSDPTAVANDDRTNGLFDALGKQIVHVGALNENLLDGKANYTNATAADVIAAQGVGVKIAVTSVLVVNGHATVGTKVEIRRGTTVMFQGYAAALGGGFSYNGGGRPLFLTGANEAVTARNVTTGADVDVHVSGYKTAI